MIVILRPHVVDVTPAWTQGVPRGYLRPGDPDRSGLIRAYVVCLLHGATSLDLGETESAERYFERGLSASPTSVRSDYDVPSGEPSAFTGAPWCSEP